MELVKRDFAHGPSDRLRLQLTIFHIASEEAAQCRCTWRSKSSLKPAWLSVPIAEEVYRSGDLFAIIANVTTEVIKQLSR